MPTRNAYRHHTARFKLQVCQDIREGVRSRSESIKEFRLSSALIQQWMTKFDSGLLDAAEDEAPDQPLRSAYRRARTKGRATNDGTRSAA